jgi:2-alkyl-3-oxoalkanoate reductase
VIDGAAAPIAMTGASGFLGRAICEQALASGLRVRALARNINALPAHEHLTPIAGDLRDASALLALCAGARGVIHCAGLVKARSREEFFAINAQAAQDLARVAVQRGATRFVFISSLAAREPALSAYCASKAAAEDMLRALPGLDWTILRPPAIYGPGDSELAKLMALARFGWAPALGPPSARISMIHVRDAARAALAALASQNTIHRLYEVDDGAGGHGWQDMARALGQAGGRHVRSLPIPPWLASFAAIASMAATRVSGRANILTLGKLRELRHADWVARAGDLAVDAGWRAQISLAAGFAELQAGR